MSTRLRRRAARGFTLIEAVMVIVITGILAGMVTVFIRLPLTAYADVATRTDLSEVADTALRRISRDVRLALPNSVRLSADGRTLGLLLTKTGGRYLALEDDTPGTVLDFVNPANLSFTVVGEAVPAGRPAIAAGDFIVVYNLGSGFAPADAYTLGNAAAVTAVNSATNLITLAANPFAVADPVMASPDRRFQVVTGTVNFFCDSYANGGAGKLWRYLSDKQIVAAQASPPAGVASLLASNVQSCSFSYSTLASTHSALVGISITLQQPGSEASGPLSLFHQINVNNTP